MLNLIQQIKGRGLPVILISHNMPNVFEVSDRIHIARLGGCAGVITPKSHSDRGGGHHDRGDHPPEGLTRSGPSAHHFAPRTPTTPSTEGAEVGVRVRRGDGPAGAPRRLRPRVAPCSVSEETADPTPGEAAHQLLGLVEGNFPVSGETQ